MHLSNRYSSITMISLKNILEQKICVDNYSRTAVYFERFSVVLGHSPKASSAKHLLVKKACFKKMTFNFGPWNFQYLRN